MLSPSWERFFAKRESRLGEVEEDTYFTYAMGILSPLEFGRLADERF